jgi:hypothetical protein
MIVKKHLSILLFFGYLLKLNIKYSDLKNILFQDLAIKKPNFLGHFEGKKNHYLAKNFGLLKPKRNLTND